MVALLWAATQGRPYKNQVSLDCTNLLPSGLGAGLIVFSSRPPVKRGGASVVGQGISLCRNFQTKASEIITIGDLCSQGVELLCRRLWRMPTLVSCPLRIACITSMSAIVHPAAQKDLKPNMGCVRRFTARWSCSMDCSEHSPATLPLILPQ